MDWGPQALLMALQASRKCFLCFITTCLFEKQQNMCLLVFVNILLTSLMVVSMLYIYLAYLVLYLPTQFSDGPKGGGHMRARLRMETHRNTKQSLD